MKIDIGEMGEHDPVRVYLNGERVERDCMIADEEAGYVVLARRNDARRIVLARDVPHRCLCYGAIAVEVRTGTVRIEPWPKEGTDNQMHAAGSEAP